MNEQNHPDFKPEQFALWFISWPEWPRIDFKSSILKVDDEANKFSFARHLIAFANVARRIGKRCWIVFGVHEDENTGARVIVDVKKQYPGPKKPRGWDNPRASLPQLQADGVEKMYTDTALNWIEPPPDFTLRYGEYEGKFLSYLQVEPTNSSKPYCLKRSYVPSQGTSYDKGTVFIRLGSSTVKVPSEEVQYLLPASKVAYLSKQDWQAIVERAKAGSDQFFDMLNAFPLYDTSDRAVFETILEHLNNGEKFIAFVGNAGQGKTTGLNALAWELARQVNTEGMRNFFGDSSGNMLYSVARELEVVPNVQVPIKIELRKDFENTATLEKEILKAMLGSIPDDRTLEHFWRIPGSRWVLLLDGMDEIANFEEFAPRLQTWIGQLPKNVQVVLSSRPYALGEHDGKQVEIAPLNNEWILELIEKRISSKLVEQAPYESKVITEYLQQEKEVFDLLRIPRAIIGFLVAWFDDPSFEISTERDELPVRHTLAQNEQKEDDDLTSTERRLFEIELANFSFR